MDVVATPVDVRPNDVYWMSSVWLVELQNVALTDRDKGHSVSAYHPRPRLFTVSVDHSHDGDKFLTCAGKAILAGGKKMATMPDTVAAYHPGGALIDMGKKTAEYLNQNAPALAAAITSIFPSASSAGPAIAEGIGEVGKFGAKFAVYVSGAVGIYEAGKSYKEQVDAGECGQ